MVVRQKTIIIRFLEYLVVLFLILDCNSVYAVAFRDYYINEIAAILIVFLLLVRFTFLGLKRSTMRRWLNYHVVYYAIALFLMVMSVSAQEVYEYVSRFIIVLPLLSMLLLHYAEKRNDCRLFEIFSNITLALSVISIFFWIFASNLHLIHPTGGMRMLWIKGANYPSYFGVYFEYQTQDFLFYSGLRNMGIFAEAPMYSFVLVMAIAYEIFLRPNYVSYTNSIKVKRRSRVRLAILILALLTTVTTTGYIVLLGIIVLKYMISKPKEARIRMLKRLSVIFVIGLAAFVAFGIFRQKTTSAYKNAWFGRADDLYAGFQGWLHSPVYGNGYRTYEKIDSFRGAFLAGGSGGYSNSLMLVLAQGGLVFLFMYIYPALKAIWVSVKTRQYGLMSFSLVFIVEFTFTVLTGTITVLFFVALLYALSTQQPNKQISILYGDISTSTMTTDTMNVY